MDEDINKYIRKSKLQDKAHSAGLTFDELKKKTIIAALLRNDGSPVAAARELGVNRSTMYKWRARYGLLFK